jgi:hypothetical protein
VFDLVSDATSGYETLAFSLDRISPSACLRVSWKACRELDAKLSRA